MLIVAPLEWSQVTMPTTELPLPTAALRVTETPFAPVPVEPADTAPWTRLAGIVFSLRQRDSQSAGCDHQRIADRNRPRRRQCAVPQHIARVQRQDSVPHLQ